MPEIIEILWPQTPPTFTVDTTGPLFVGFDAPFTATDYRDANNSTNFQPEDNFIIESYGISFDYCFSPSTTDIRTNLRRFQNPNTYNISEINSHFLIPINGAEIPLGVFVPFRDPDLAFDPSLPYSLRLTGISGEISMVNVPAVLNGEVLQALPWVKVRHNLPLG